MPFAIKCPELGLGLLASVAFCICAIQETFKEAGLLVVMAASDAASTSASPACLLVPEHLPLGPELAEWWWQVQRQLASFSQLCCHLRCVPNIGALHKWKYWLTPMGQARWAAL
ncbi:hypothetical protein JRQ81_013418 [Phrynocephalus forsythii]|uniref:Secreted protein n=1 Tax=Phrynocephalus forsythii TaxID=171643 RepID=A0A9Q1B499_9SAUR|nr:hypothetical protein JRQ81_013418 [Phrynocephalus forsythii]